MFGRLQLRPLPYPLCHLPTQAQTLAIREMPSLVATLLEQASGLADVCLEASHSAELSHEALRASLEVLSGYVESALALHQRWQREAHAEGQPVPTPPPGEPSTTTTAEV